MKIEIYEIVNGDMKKVLESYYSYSEAESRQEKKPAFFISTNGGENSGYEIYFSTDNLEEIDNLIKNLQEIRAGFTDKLK